MLEKIIIQMTHGNYKNKSNYFTPAHKAISLETRLMYDGAVATLVDTTSTDIIVTKTTDETIHEPVTASASNIKTPSIFSGTDTGSITENSNNYTSNGSLTVTSVDSVPSLISQSNILGAYGRFSINENGNWIYTADNTKLKPLTSTAEATDTFSVKAEDGTTHDIVITLNGVPDLISVREIAIIDSALPDVDQLIACIPSSIEIHLIDTNSSGISQLLAILAGQNGIDAIHIFSHGASGSFRLGTDSIDSNTIDQYTAQLTIVGLSLKADGDILLYGCNIGQDSQFIDQLSILTGADVAASYDTTGSSIYGGNWALEYQTGDIHTQALNLESYKNVLIGDGLTATIYNSTSGATPSLSSGTYAGTTVVGSINYDWGAGAVLGYGSEQVRVTFTGYLVAPESGDYTFYNQSDDGFILTLNGTQIISNWVEQGNVATFPYNSTSSQINLVQGKIYSIRVDYYENGGGAVAKLYWKKPSSSSSEIVTGVFGTTYAMVNTAPTLSTINTLTGATDTTTYTISYTELASAANESDYNGDTLSFRVESLSSGTLTKNGSAVVTGSTLLSPGESLVWTPAANANGTLNAFTVKAWDGYSLSDTAIQVKVSVDSAPIVSGTSTLAYTENQSATVVNGSITVSDSDNSTFSSATASISNNYVWLFVISSGLRIIFLKSKLSCN